LKVKSCIPSLNLMLTLVCKKRPLAAKIFILQSLLADTKDGLCKKLHFKGPTVDVWCVVLKLCSKNHFGCWQMFKPSRSRRGKTVAPRAKVISTNMWEMSSSLRFAQWDPELMSRICAMLQKVPKNRVFWRLDQLLD